MIYVCRTFVRPPSMTVFQFGRIFCLGSHKNSIGNIIKKWNNIIAYQPKYVLNKANAAIFVFPKSTSLLTNWSSVLMMHISFANICFSVLFVGLFFDLLWNEMVTAKDDDDDKLWVELKILYQKQWMLTYCEKIKRWGLSAYAYST